jgi:hypothetical protein
VLGTLFALAVTTITVSVAVYFLRGDVRDLTLAGRTSQVATCYASARGRPALIDILRVLAGAAQSSDERETVNGFIDRYENDTPTIRECDELARMRGLDPKDFPSPPAPSEREDEREGTAP